jgi:hypothetical protein
VKESDLERWENLMVSQHLILITMSF